MIKEKNKKEKVCMFFVSDYHFEMISLPYIKDRLDKNKNILIMTENNLESTINKVLSMVNLTEKEKEKIRKIDWNNKNNKIDKINKEEETTIFIKGKEKYIEEVEEKIKEIKNFKNIQIIDCYDINEVNSNLNYITRKYDNILSTTGIEKLI